MNSLMKLDAFLKYGAYGFGAVFFIVTAYLIVNRKANDKSQDKLIYAFALLGTLLVVIGFFVKNNKPQQATLNSVMSKNNKIRGRQTTSDSAGNQNIDINMFSSDSNDVEFNQSFGKDTVIDK